MRCACSAVSLPACLLFDSWQAGVMFHLSLKGCTGLVFHFRCFEASFYSPSTQPFLPILWAEHATQIPLKKSNINITKGIWYAARISLCDYKLWPHAALQNMFLYQFVISGKIRVVDGFYCIHGWRWKVNNYMKIKTVDKLVQLCVLSI